MRKTKTQPRYLKVSDMDMMIHPMITRVLLSHGANPAGEYHLVPENHPDISFFLICIEKPEWITTTGFNDTEIHSVTGK